MKIPAPMLASTGGKDMLQKPGMLFEPKLDGIRAILEYGKGKIKLFNRKGQDISQRYPELDVIGIFKAKDCVLDGEVILYNEEGNPDFHQLLQRNNPGRLPVTYVAFDILEKNGKDLSSLPLTKRKIILDKTLVPTERIQKMFYTREGTALWDFIKARKLEGVMAKTQDSLYIQGYRTDSWQKIKDFKTQDCIIVGYSTGKRELSALGLAAYNKNKLQFIGKVGTGFSETVADELLNELKHILIDKPVFAVPPRYNGIQWVKPSLACEIRYLEFGPEGMMRNPSFLRLRPDKPLEECIINEDYTEKKILKEE